MTFIQPTCAEDDCDKPITTAGLCSTHYQRKRRRDAGATPRATYPKGATCTIEGCDLPIKGKGLCNAHYMRVRRGSPDPTGAVTQTFNPCSFDGCGRVVHAGDLCGGHYYQKRHGKGLTAIADRSQNDGECAVDDCGRDAAHSGLCPSHYDRKRKGQDDWDRPIKSKAANGEGHVNDDGYRLVHKDGRNIMEHRWKMEQLLGRRLLPNENVHHVNGKRDDNRTNGPLVMDDRGRLRSGNLELWSTRQPKGQRVGDKLAYAKELLALYGTDAEREEYAAHSPLTGGV